MRLSTVCVGEDMLALMPCTLLIGIMLGVSSLILPRTSPIFVEFEIWLNLCLALYFVLLNGFMITPLPDTLLDCAMFDSRLALSPMRVAPLCPLAIVRARLPHNLVLFV